MEAAAEEEERRAASPDKERRRRIVRKAFRKLERINSGREAAHREARAMDALLRRVLRQDRTIRRQQRALRRLDRRIRRCEDEEEEEEEEPEEERRVRSLLELSASAGLRLSAELLRLTAQLERSRRLCGRRRDELAQLMLQLRTLGQEEEEEEGEEPEVKGQAQGRDPEAGPGGSERGRRPPRGVCRSLV